MNLTLQQIQTLHAVITHGSIQAAAQSLNKTHPSVIALLNKLEHSLDIPLFDRSGYRLSLTEEGALFYQHSQRTLHEMAGKKYLSARRETGTLEKGKKPNSILLLAT